jgi:hypothetical protein
LGRPGASNLRRRSPAGQALRDRPPAICRRWAGGRPAACKAAVAERRHGQFEPDVRHQWAATCCRRAVLHCSGRRGGRPAALRCPVPVRGAMQHSGRFALNNPGSSNGRMRGCYPRRGGSNPSPGANVPAHRVRAMRSPSDGGPEGRGRGGGRSDGRRVGTSILGMRSFDVVAWITAAQRLRPFSHSQRATT